MTKIDAVKLKGSSMLPLFKDGDMVLYQKVDAENILIGDCVIYYYKGKSLLHRVVGKTGDNFIIANDDNLTKHIVPFRDILGKVYTKNIFKKGFSGLVYHKLIRIIRRWMHWLN